MVCTGSAASRCFQAGVKYGNGEFIQVHPTAIPGADKLRLMSESARGEGGRVWVPRTPQDPRDPRDIPESERYYFLEERYPAYGNLVPRDIATREIFDICVNEGLSVEADRQCVYLDLTHIPSAGTGSQAGRHPGDLREVPGRRSARDADEDLPRRALLDGRPVGRLRSERPTAGCKSARRATRQTNIPGLYAIGECDYQYHGANRLGANSLLSCIFGGLIRRAGDRRAAGGPRGPPPADQPASLVRQCRAGKQQTTSSSCCSARPAARTRT